MAEIVHFRVEKTLVELNTLVDVGLLTTKMSKEILLKRQNFEYKLRKRTRTKVDYLRYIKYETNLLEAIEKYRNTVLKNYSDALKAIKSNDDKQDIDRKIILLQAKRLNSVIRKRAAHISSLYMKMTTTYQFDKQLWLIYIDFAKKRKWNTRVTALYWRALRVNSTDERLWIEATNHEVKVNKAYDVSRGLFLRALRHFPKSVDLWISYFEMEVDFMSYIYQRAQILTREDKSSSVLALDVKQKSNGDEQDDNNPEDLDEEQDSSHHGNLDLEEGKVTEEDKLPNVKAILEDNLILSAELPKVVFKNALENLRSENHVQLFVISALKYLIFHPKKTDHMDSLIESICNTVFTEYSKGDERFGESLVNACKQPKQLDESMEMLENELAEKLQSSTFQSKRQRVDTVSDKLDECYGEKGIVETRALFKDLEKSVKNQTHYLYKTMIEIEYMELIKDKTHSKLQLDTIRKLFNTVTNKFGSEDPDLWIEYLKLESWFTSNLADLKRLSDVYHKAKLSLKNEELMEIVDEEYAKIQAGYYKKCDLIKFPQ